MIGEIFIGIAIFLFLASLFASFVLMATDSVNEDSFVIFTVVFLVSIFFLLGSIAGISYAEGKAIENGHAEHIDGEFRWKNLDTEEEQNILENNENN